MNTARRDLRGGQAVKLVRNTGNVTVGATTSFVDVHADLTGLVQTDSGLLVCEASFRCILTAAPQYQVFFRWLIDGVAPDTTDAHTGIINYSATPITGQLWPVRCRAALRVKPGLHRVALQARTDVGGTTNTVAASATEPLVATISCQ